MRLLWLSFLFLLSSDIFGQGQPIGAWAEHLPYNRGKMLADAGQKIYCATNDGLFAYLKDDDALERYSRLTGLHDFGVSSIAYSSQYNVLVIGYSNANIDLLYDDGSVFNLSFIKEKNITGLKTINKIYVKGRFAYLGCGFGIVVLDIERQEIRDTYYIGALGALMNVLDVADDGNYIYAATDSGVFAASLASANLADYNNWNRILDDSNNAGDFNMLIYFNGNIYVNYAKPDAVSTSEDQLWKYENGSWSLFSHPDLPSSPRRTAMHVISNQLVVVNEYSTGIFNDSWQRIAFYDNSLYPNALMKDGITADGTVWIADRNNGLIRIIAGNVSKLLPSGPSSPYVADLQTDGHTLWVVHGPKSISWGPQDYPIDGFSSFADGAWTSFNQLNVPSMAQNNFYSNMSVSMVPGSAGHIRVGSVTSGLLDFNDNEVKSYYNKDNSTLTPAVGNTTQTIAHGIAHDEAGNLWVVNSGVPNVFHVLKNDGTWKSMNMQGIINGAPFAGYILIDHNDYKWVNLFGGSGTTTQGLAVLDDHGTIDNESDDRRKYVAADVYLRCMAVDQDGQIWVGTDKGPQVIYSPSAVFDENIALEKILIKQDNTYQYLLENEIVTYIAVDGANRKWIGTQSSGIYLLSPDGQQEIHHFTAENSPLFSNNITAIGINNRSGEVFIGTDKGLISYQSDAIEGSEECESVVVYPNPVRPAYDGPIAIKGIMNNAKVKITDINGGLIYESTALGGQAIWNGRNFKGEKASTGVYLVFASDEAGVNACITKLLFVK